LRSVKGLLGNIYGDTELFNSDQKRELDWYLDRNKWLARWIKPPTVASQPVWPEGLHLADRAGPDSLFSALRGLSGLGLGLSQGTR